MPCPRDDLPENRIRLYKWAEKWQNKFIVGKYKVNTFRGK